MQHLFTQLEREPTHMCLGKCLMSVVLLPKQTSSHARRGACSHSQKQITLTHHLYNLQVVRIYLYFIFICDDIIIKLNNKVEAFPYMPLQRKLLI